MTKQFRLTPINLSDSTVLDTGVEHRRVFSLRHCELNIFETLHRCPSVALSYNGLAISSMMRGKKRMTLNGVEQFDFLPGETVILPEGVSLKVDFPEVDSKHPVQCATLALDWGMVNKNIAFLNEQYPNTDFPFEWKLNFSKYHFVNNRELTGSINKLIGISMENSPAKDGLADLSLKFLLLRIIQTQNLALVSDKALPNHLLNPSLQYIKEHLTEKLSVDTMAREACMSKSSFFRAFKQQFGSTPIEYVLRERIEYAKRLMAIPAITVTEVCFQSGFNNLNYFIKLFKRIEKVTPSAYKA